jgi:hypothetical protein
LDGVYTDAKSMIAPSSPVSGSPNSPITIRALHDGKALIDGQGKQWPIHLLHADWLVIEGVDACCSSGTVVGLSQSNHNVIRRVTAWDAAEGNEFIFGVHYGDYNLLEDVAGWGVARKIFSSSQKGNYTTIRRAWGRWEGSHVVGPKATYELAYNNHDMTVENAIGTWSGEKMKDTYVLLDYNGRPWSGRGEGTYTNSRVNQPDGVFVLGVGEPNIHAKLLGSLAYVGGADMFQAERAIFTTKSSFATIRDCVVYIEPGANAKKNTFGLYGLLPADLSAVNVTSFGGAGPAIGAGWQVTNSLQGSSPEGTYAPGENIFNTKRGADLCRRYRDGILTNDPLWPWPMNQRIVDALVRSGRQPVDVTTTIERFFGKIPQECRETPLGPSVTAAPPNQSSPRR